jgi:hypothetical protein
MLRPGIPSAYDGRRLLAGFQALELLSLRHLPGAGSAELPGLSRRVLHRHLLRWHWLGLPRMGRRRGRDVGKPGSGGASRSAGLRQTLAQA